MNGSVKEKDCSLQGQGHSYGSYTKNMVVSTTSSELQILLPINLVWWNTVGSILPGKATDLVLKGVYLHSLSFWRVCLWVLHCMAPCLSVTIMEHGLLPAKHFTTISCSSFNLSCLLRPACPPACLPAASSIERGSITGKILSGAQTASVRTDFPETWLWDVVTVG